MPTFGFGSNEPNITPGGDRVGGFAQKIKELFADLYDKLNSVTWSNATQSSAGFMSVDDKKKLDCIYYGECSTAAATAAKVVTCAAFTLAAGSRVIVKFTVTNTAASPTLNVNSTGAKAIQYRGAAITAGYLAANRTYEFVYDGTNWQLVGDIDTNTDTHWTSHLYAGASNGTANAATTNGNTYLILCDNTTARDRRKIAGSGATTVTSDASGNITISSTNTTYSNFVKSGSTAAAGLVPSPGTTAGTTKYLREDATWQVPPNTVYTHPTTSGNKHIPSGGSSGQILRWSADGTAAWGSDNNTTYSNFVKSGSSAHAGLVPAPSTTAGTTKYLREDATWQVPPDNNTTYTNFVKSGSSAKAGLVPSPGTTAGTTKYLREDATWQVPPNTNTVTTASTTGSGNAVTAVTASNGALTVTKGDIFLTDGTDQTITATKTAKVNNKGWGIMSADGAYSQYFRVGSGGVNRGIWDANLGKWMIHANASTCYFNGYELNKSVPSNAVFTDNNTTYSNMTAATASAAGTAGLVPAPAAGVVSRCLLANATWGYPAQIATARTITCKIKIGSTTFSGNASFNGTGNITIDLGTVS